MRAGKPSLRPPGDHPPCWQCPKSKDGQPNPAADLSPKNWRAYDYCQQCRADAQGLLPRDLIVIRNNAIVQMVERAQQQSRDPLRLLLALLGGKAR